MDVRNGVRPIRLILLAAGLHLLIGTRAPADPVYTAIDLGIASPPYNVIGSGAGTVTGSYGQTYPFNATKDGVPLQWLNVTQGVPIVEPAPTGSQDTDGNPNNAYSYSYLDGMNAQGLAVGVNLYGVSGHLGNGEAFITQLQADGSWGPPTLLWSGAPNVAESGDSPESGGDYHLGIVGVSANGQVLGVGVENPSGPPVDTLYLYDTKTQTLTNMTSLIDSMKWTDSTQLPSGQSRMARPVALTRLEQSLFGFVSGDHQQGIRLGPAFLRPRLDSVGAVPHFVAGDRLQHDPPQPTPLRLRPLPQRRLVRLQGLQGPLETHPLRPAAMGP